MKTFQRILLILLNILLPCILPILLVFICFFIYGSGASGTEKLENEMYIWIGIYSMAGLMHLFLAYKYLRFFSKKQKFLFTAILALLYLYFAFNYMK